MGAALKQIITEFRQAINRIHNSLDRVNNNNSELEKKIDYLIEDNRKLKQAISDQIKALGEKLSK